MLAWKSKIAKKLSALHRNHHLTILLLLSCLLLPLHQKKICSLFIKGKCVSPSTSNLKLVSLYHLHLTNASTLPWAHHHRPIELRSREKGRVGEAERREDGEGERGLRSSDSPGITSCPLQLRPPIRL